MFKESEISWQKQLTQIITDPKILWQKLQLPESLLPAAYEACKQFPLRAPLPYVARMQIGNIQDPLLKQVLPLAQELQQQLAYNVDPLAEQNSNPLPGLLHKYRSRVLLMVTNACAINCRYCFRRHFPYDENNPSLQQWQQVHHYIANDPNINEVILSGGDPLAAKDSYLAKLVNPLCDIPQVKTLRIHTRLPIVIPDRITDEFCHWLEQLPLKVVMVIHCNHANEIDNAVMNAMTKLKQASVILLNQSVLLKDINDNSETLVALSEKLFQAGVMPYYLHLLDKVAGAWHFDTATATAKTIHREMQSHLPGYLVPKLVVEKAGEDCKQWVV